MLRSEFSKDSAKNCLARKSSYKLLLDSFHRRSYDQLSSIRRLMLISSQFASGREPQRIQTHLWKPMMRFDRNIHGIGWFDILQRLLKPVSLPIAKKCPVICTFINLMKGLCIGKPAIILLVFFLLSIQVSAAYCPPNCGCTSGTIDCQKCLQYYFREYSTSSKTCVCMSGFKELEPTQESCTPSNCSRSSSTVGCYTCPSKWMISVNYLLSVASCVCQPNYYYDGTDCICNAQMNPTLFYEDILSVACFQCPQGCRCDASGCAECASQTLRTVTFDITGRRKVCNCIAPYLLVNGMCVCPKLCQCNSSTGSMSCDPSSNRVLSKYGVWACRWPYTDTHFECVCQPNFISVNSSIVGAYDPSQQCMCTSVVDSINYYLNGKGSCLACEHWCLCNENGCYSCQAVSNRAVTGNKCDCVAPYVGFYGICICV
jgi:hypothetical protein